jgi:hypothetical protein
MNLREKYLAVKNAPLGSSIIPEWGLTYFRALTLADMARLKDADDVGALLFSVLLGVCDESGGRVFDDTDAESLKELPWSVVQSVAENVHAFNKLTAEGVCLEKKDLLTTESAAS